MLPENPIVQSVAPAHPETHESRWGFHAVSLEDFLILKEMKKLYWKSVAQAAEWARWARKAPHNRVSRTWERGVRDGKPYQKLMETVPKSEPTYNPKVFDRGQMYGLACHKYRYAIQWRQLAMPRELELAHETYHEARIPRKSPADVRPIDMKPFRECWARLQEG